MTAAVTVCQDALRKHGAHSQMAPADADTITTVRDSLMSLLAMWLSSGIDLGTKPVFQPGEELDEPTDARQAIVDNLAVVIAPDFYEGTVPPLLVANARRGYMFLDEHYRAELTVDRKKLSGTTPRGSGHSDFFGDLYDSPFFDEGTTVG